MKTTWPLLLVTILVGIFSTTSAIRAEDYKDSKFPSDEIIARNILQLMVHNIKKTRAKS
jgi:hypothetical protein